MRPSLALIDIFTKLTITLPTTYALTSKITIVVDTVSHGVTRLQSMVTFVDVVTVETVSGVTDIARAFE